ncbi:MAG: hypothetical protein ABIL16_06745 [candidate division WOR-3 bacterium]
MVLVISYIATWRVNLVGSEVLEGQAYGNSVYAVALQEWVITPNEVCPKILPYTKI